MILMSGFLRPFAVLLTTVVLLLAAGCGKAAPGSTSSTASLKVVVAFYPLQFIAERVAGTQAEITSLTQPGAEPHDLELTPRQVASLSDADVVIYQKGFQAAVDQAVAQAQPKRVVDASTLVTMHEETDGHDHGSEGGEEPAGHDEHPMDPHIWLDPINMGIIGTAVAKEFAAARPDEAATFTANGERLATDMTTLDGEFSAGLKTCERREFITSHAAFGYLAERYKLTQIGISGLDPEAEPSPARIAEIHTDAEKYGITTIFYETLVSPTVAKSIAGDLGLQTAVLDPIEGITDQSAGTDYSSVMRANLAALEKANACT